MKRRRAYVRTPPRERHDVVFYTPWIGSLLTGGPSVPPGGAETQILRLSEALAKRGLRVGIVVYGEPRDLPEFVQGVRIIPRAPYRKRKALGKVTEVLTIWHSLWRAPARTVVYRAVGAELALLSVYCKFARRRLIFSSANIVDFDCRRLLRKRRDVYLYEYGVRHVDEIVVQTEEQVEMCEGRFGRHPQVIKSLASVAERQSELPEAFLWVGRLVPYKAPLEYVALARSVPEARFWMIGVPSLDSADQSLNTAVRAAAEEVPNLELLAPRTRSGVAALMLRAVASVNTALYEGMPNVLLEAWVHGVPALVLEHDPGGVVARYGLGGFAAGSRERLASLASEQWRQRRDEDERARLADRCQRYVADHHAPNVLATRWMAVIDGESHGESVREAAGSECVA